MKKYLVTIALVVLAASPAMAAARHRNYDEAAKASFAMHQADEVVFNGRVVGQDPDAAIRADLLRQGDPTLVNGQ